MTLSMEQIINTLVGAGYDFNDVSPEKMPTYRKDIICEFEKRCQLLVEVWAYDEISMYELVDTEVDGTVYRSAEWNTPDPGHRFHVELPGMRVEDLYYVLGEHVVYKYFVEEDEHAHELEVGAEVISATRTRDGLSIEMAITLFREENGMHSEEWGEVAEDGFLFWQQQQLEKK